MHRGYVKLWRRSIDSRVFKNPDLLKVWIWCLMRANHKSTWVEMKTGKSKIEVKVEPGQFVFGRKSAAKELGMPESSVRNRMVKLKNMRNVDIKEDRQYSIVSIMNWDIYQADEKKEGSKEDRQRTGKGQAKDTTNNVNNVNNNIYSDQTSSESPSLSVNFSPTDKCPHQEILNLWAQIMPDQIQPKVWDSTRQTNLRSRWREDPERQKIEYWERLFNYIRKSAFLMGKVEPTNGHKKFEITLPWVIKLGNFNKIIEGNYDK